MSTKNIPHNIKNGLALFRWASSNLFSALVFRSGRLLLAAGEPPPLLPAGESDLIRSGSCSCSGSLLSRSVSFSFCFSLSWDLDGLFFLYNGLVPARMEVVEWTEIILLDTTVLDTFEFQGSTRTIVVVGHDWFAKRTGGPIWPTKNFVGTPGRQKYSLEALFCGWAER